MSSKMKAPQPRRDRPKRPPMIRIMAPGEGIIPKRRGESLHLPVLRLSPLEPEDYA